MMPKTSNAPDHSSTTCLNRSITMAKAKTTAAPAKHKAPKARSTDDLEGAEMYARFAEETTADVLAADQKVSPERYIAAIEAFIKEALTRLPGHAAIADAK